MILRHARLQLEYKGGFSGIREMRKHVAWYTKGLKGAARLRERVNAVESLEAVSYTHLDVYKRQRLYFACCLCMIIAFLI